MSKILNLFNHKGGVSKTTTVFNLSWMLASMGKRVISIDLNPMSRTSRAAHVAIVDELTRALPNVERFAKELKDDPAETARVAKSYDKASNMRALASYLGLRLRTLNRPRRISVRRPTAASVGRH